MQPSKRDKIPHFFCHTFRIDTGHKTNMKFLTAFKTSFPRKKRVLWLRRKGTAETANQSDPNLRVSVNTARPREIDQLLGDCQSSFGDCSVDCQQKGQDRMFDMIQCMEVDVEENLTDSPAPVHHQRRRSSTTSVDEAIDQVVRRLSLKASFGHTSDKSQAVKPISNLSLVARNFARHLSSYGTDNGNADDLSNAGVCEGRPALCRQKSTNQSFKGRLTSLRSSISSYCHCDEGNAQKGNGARRCTQDDSPVAQSFINRVILLYHQNSAPAIMERELEPRKSFADQQGGHHSC